MSRILFHDTKKDEDVVTLPGINNLLCICVLYVLTYRLERSVHLLHVQI